MSIINRNKIVFYDSSFCRSSYVNVMINDIKIPVYKTKVNNSHKWTKTPILDECSFSYFDFTEKINVKLLFSYKVKSVVIRPLKYKITPKIVDNIVSFDIENTDNYAIEINGSIMNPIYLFAGNLKIPEDNIRYITSGVHEEDIEANDNETIYIPGDAVIKGKIIVNDKSNVTICGRGIIDGSSFPSWINYKAIPQIDANNSSNLKIKGLIFLDSNCWALNLYQCKNVEIKDIKIITCRPNGDGISLQSCESVNVSNSFVRTWDDSLVVKNYSSVNSHDIYFDNIQIWTDLAQSCEIGYETNKSKSNNSQIYNVNFSNITVLHNFHKPVISIHNADNAWVHNIYYNNILIEDAQMGQGDAKDNNQLIDLNTFYSSNWSSTKERGLISDVQINNVKVLNGIFPPSRIFGCDIKHTISNVTISNVEILNCKIKNEREGKFFINEFTSNIKFK